MNYYDDASILIGLSIADLEDILENEFTSEQQEKFNERYPNEIKKIDYLEGMLTTVVEGLRNQLLIDLRTDLEDELS